MAFFYYQTIANLFWNQLHIHASKEQARKWHFLLLTSCQLPHPSSLAPYCICLCSALFTQLTGILEEALLAYPVPSRWALGSNKTQEASFSRSSWGNKLWEVNLRKFLSGHGLPAPFTVQVQSLGLLSPSPLPWEVPLRDQLEGSASLEVFVTIWVARTTEVAGPSCIPFSNRKQDKVMFLACL